MRPPAKKKAVAKKAAAKKAVRKPAAGTKSSGSGVPPKGDGGTLAGRIVTAPQLVDPKAAGARVTDWLAGLPAGEAKPLKVRFAAHRTVSTLLESLAENSPYLWELANREPDRLLRLLD